MKTLILAFLILFISCKTSMLTDSNTGKIGLSNYYILEIKLDDKYPFFENVQPTELTHEEILEMEKIIESRIEKTTGEYREETENKYSESDYQYDRQYLAAINQNGEKLIWINFFCDQTMGDFYDLNKEMTNIADGGKCFFQIIVNLTKKEIISYRFNGIA